MIPTSSWGLYAVRTQEYVLVFERKFCLVMVFIQIIASWMKRLRDKGLDDLSANYFCAISPLWFICV